MLIYSLENEEVCPMGQEDVTSHFISTVWWRWSSSHCYIYVTRHCLF